MKITTFKTSRALFLCLFVLAAFLRLYKLGYHSLWLDEAISYSRALMTVPDILRTSYLYDVHPPTYYLILHIFLKLGHSESFVRMFSAICGIAAVPVFYLYARDLTENKVALTGVFFLAVSIFHVVYAQEARAYALFFLSAVLWMIFFIRSLSTGDRKYWFLWAGAFLVNFHIHYFSLFLLACQMAFLVFYFLLNKDKFAAQQRNLLIAIGIILAGSIPQTILFFKQAGTKVNPDIDYWQVRNPFRFALILLKNTYYPITLNNGFLDRILKYCLGFFLLTGIISGYKRYRYAVILNGALLIMTAALTWTGSFFMVISGNFRYIIFINIFLTMLYAVAVHGWADWITTGVNKLWNRFQKNPHAIIRPNTDIIVSGLILTSFLLLNGWILKQYYQQPRSENWSDGLRIILSQYESGDVLVPMPGYTDYTIRYYLRQPDINVLFLRMDTPTVDNIEAVIAEHPRVFFIITNQLTQAGLRQPAEQWLQQHATKLWTDRNWPKTQIWLAENKN